MKEATYIGRLFLKSSVFTFNAVKKLFSQKRLIRKEMIWEWDDIETKLIFLKCLS